jgi:hypothetical protein
MSHGLTFASCIHISPRKCCLSINCSIFRAEMRLLTEHESAKRWTVVRLRIEQRLGNVLKESRETSIGGGKIIAAGQEEVWLRVKLLGQEMEKFTHMDNACRNGGPVNRPAGG